MSAYIWCVWKKTILKQLLDLVNSEVNNCHFFVQRFHLYFFCLEQTFLTFPMSFFCGRLLHLGLWGPEHTPLLIDSFWLNGVHSSLHSILLHFLHCSELRSDGCWPTINKNIRFSSYLRHVCCVTTWHGAVIATLWEVSGSVRWWIPLRRSPRICGCELSHSYCGSKIFLIFSGNSYKLYRL